MVRIIDPNVTALKSAKTAFQARRSQYQADRAAARTANVGNTHQAQKPIIRQFDADRQAYKTQRKTMQNTMRTAKRDEKLAQRQEQIGRKATQMKGGRNDPKEAAKTAARTARLAKKAIKPGRI